MSEIQKKIQKKMKKVLKKLKLMIINLMIQKRKMTKKLSVEK